MKRTCSVPEPAFWWLAGLLAAAAVTLPTQVRAGVVLRVETKNARVQGSKPEVRHTTIDGRYFRTDERGPGGELVESVIFDGARKVLFTIVHDEKTYFALEGRSMEETLSQYNAQMEAAIARLEQNLGDLQPEQVEKIKNSIALRRQAMARGERASLMPLAVEDSGHTENINGRRCRRYDVMQDGEKVREVWATSWESLELSPKSFSVFDDFGEFFQSLMASGAQHDQELVKHPFVTLHQIDGFPVLIRKLQGERIMEETRLFVEDTKAVEPSYFRPPQGYLLTARPSTPSHLLLRRP